jgi:hypothetical protein
MKKFWPVLGMLALAACGSKGCSCTQPIKGGYPVKERHEGAMQIRATESLFQYLSQNGATIIPKLLPGGTTFNVPPTCSGPVGSKICCAMPAPMCRVQIDFTALTLTPTAPNVIQLEADLTLKTLDFLPVQILGGTCMISIDSTMSGGPTMHVSAPIALPVDQTTDLANITIDSNAVNITGLDANDVKDDNTGSTPFICTGLNLFNGALVGILESQVKSQISSAVAGQTCMKCATKDDCNAFAADCMNGQCVDAMKNCVQEIGLEGKMDVGSALASFAPGTQAFMDVLAVAGGWSVADTGLSLGMLGGSRGDPHSACVPMTQAPSPPPIVPSTTFFTNVLPDGATPYHLGIGVHRTELDSLGWGAFDGGALCLHIGTPQIALLSSKTIGLIVPSLADLVHVADAPIYLSMRPAVAPTFTLGKGTFKTDAMGMRTVDDPLMNVYVPDFAIDFWAMVDERYIRVMTLTADLRLPVSLDIDQTGKIVPLLGDVTAAFTNLRVSNSELLAESPDDLRAAFPTLLGVAVGNLTSALKPIALPAIMGLNIKPVAITTTDPDKDGSNQFLSIFANLSAATPLELSADTEAHLVKLELPSTNEFSVGYRIAVIPQATIAVSGRSIEGRPLEYSYAIDDGTWSPFTQASVLTVRDPILWLQGKHIVSVRARAEGLPDSLDGTPAEVVLLVDTVAPEGGYDENGNIDAQDRVSPKSALRYRWRLDGDYTAWSPSTKIEVARDQLWRVSVQAIDEAGNVGGLEFHGRTTNPPSGSGCNCDVGGAPSSASWLALFIPLFLFRRRFLALAILAIGCNDPGLQKGDFESPLHEIGRYHDIAAKNGVFHVSAYDDSVGDLAYARITDPKQVGWQYVDGIDPAAPHDLPGDYRHGVSDPGPDVGMYSSIALTKSGDPRIAYYDATNGALKYAAGPHPFKITTVQMGDGMNLKVGLYTRITLDANDVPTIAYTATGISDGMGGFKSELRIATANGSDPSSWKFTTVDTTRIKCAGLCGAGQACIQAAMVNMMPNGDPSQSTCTTTTNDCNPACAMTEGCLMGTCTKALQAVKGDIPEGFLFTQLIAGKSGLTLIYYDHSQGDLKMATQAGGAFTVSTLDGGDPSTDRGQFCSADVGLDGTIHVAYVDAILDRLMYLSVQPSPMPEVVDDGLRDDGPHSVGAGAVIHASPLEIVYQDQVVSDLLIAKNAGSWTHQDLKTGVTGYGFYPHIVADSGKTWLSHFTYDRELPTPIGNFVLEPLP